MSDTGNDAVVSWRSVIWSYEFFFFFLFCTILLGMLYLLVYSTLSIQKR